MASVTPNKMGSGKLVREKIIIDTDPGIDDSVAIFMAFQTPQLEVLGITTIFGNVTTEDATRNALILGEIAGYPDVPVAEGSPEPLKGGTPDVAYFIHGSDGLGNTNLPPPKSKKIEKTASEFLVDMVSEYPGQVSILALGPLTNLALAVKKDSSFASKVQRVVILGGSFFALGNVNPAAEANVSAQLELRIWSDLHSLALVNNQLLIKNYLWVLHLVTGDTPDFCDSKFSISELPKDQIFLNDKHKEPPPSVVNKSVGC
ncbi:hypothetical protein ACSBR2_035367 [Camellia fascicularis]